MLELIWRGIAMGIGGTVFMDIWAIVLHRFFGQSAPNWAPVGRWFWHVPKGRIFHDSIATAAPYEHELALGWISHYAVGILYGIVLALIVPAAWFAEPSFIQPWVVGIVTVGAGWFLLQRVSASAGSVENAQSHQGSCSQPRCPHNLCAWHVCRGVADPLNK